jgi:hypothetical protein
MNLNDRLHTWWMTYVVTTGGRRELTTFLHCNWQRSCTSIRFLCSRRYKDELLLPSTRWLAGIMLEACTGPVCLNVADVLLSYSNFIYLFIYFLVCDVFSFSRRCPVVGWHCWHFSTYAVCVAIQPNVTFRDCSCCSRYIACCCVFPVTVGYIWVQKI